MAEAIERDFIDEVERLEVAVVVPDRSVRVSYATRGGIRVEVTEASLRTHSEGSLSEQVNAATAMVYRRYGVAIRDLLFDGDSAADSRLDRGPSAPPAADKEYRQLVAEGRSPRNLVKAEMRVGGYPTVRIRPGTLRRIDLGASSIGHEIDAAIASAIQDMKERLTEVHARLARGKDATR